MDPLIFKTNIQSNKHLLVIEEAFEAYPSIVDWNVDTDDIDNVLRIETEELLIEDEIINLLNKHGIICEVLEG